MRKYCRLLIAVILYLCCFEASAQRFHFPPSPEASQIIPAATIAGSSSYSSNVYKAWQYNWQYIVTNSSSWGNRMKMKSLNAFVKMKIDHSYRRKVSTPYTYLMVYSLKGYSSADTTNYTTITDTLSVNYQPDSSTAYQDYMVNRYSGFLRIDLTIQNIYAITYTAQNGIQTPTYTAVAPGSLYPNFNVEIGILSQPYYKMAEGSSTTVYGLSGTNPFISVSGTPVSGQNYLELKWGVPVSGQLLGVSPAAYELEWSYIDDYQVNAFSPSVQQTAAGNLSYNFINNSTRVTLDTNYYRIPLVYQSGYVAYRVRVVRPDSVLFRDPVYSNWTVIQDAGSLTSLSQGSQYSPVSGAHENDALNWQYTISFAEQGKYKHVLSYYDGLLKNRQSITRFNSQPDRLLVTENIYDYEGRPAIKLLPVPVQSGAFQYQDGVTKNTFGHPYKAIDFDTLRTACPLDERVPVPLASDATGNIYYSHYNPDTAGFQKYVPDAGGYPFVQTIYVPGNDKRVERQGGAGDTLQIGMGHDTKNDYVSSDQKADLTGLFGTDAGWASFYHKTVTKDPNGQYSVLVTDYEGRPVASSLIGTGPDSVKHAIITNDNVPGQSSVYEDLLLGNTQDISGNKRTLEKDFFMDYDANSQLQYVYKFLPYPVCPGKNLSVAATYHFKITNQCGKVDIEQSGVLGTTGVTSSASQVPYPSAVYSPFFAQGTHSLLKELTVSTDDVAAAVDSFMDNPGTCMYTEPYFIKQAVNAKTWPCPEGAESDCDALRKKMMAQLWPHAKYGPYSSTGVNQVYATNDYPSIFNTIHVGGGNGYDPYDAYRYQAPCINLPDSVLYMGQWYKNLRTMGVDTFIRIFNDDIAAALLPLHPEYCKLKYCYDDPFKTIFESVTDAKTAEAQHLLLLDSIIAHDSLRFYLQSMGMASPEDSLATFRGGLIRFDTLALMMSYCNCSDTAMFRICLQKIFNNEVTSKTLINDAVKTAYFNFIKPLYLANRERLKDYIRSSIDNRCGPCDTFRMRLVQPPLVPDWMTSTGISGNSPISLGSTVYNNSTAMDSLIAQLSNFNQDSINYYQNQATNNYNSGASSLCSNAIDSIISQLSSCYSPNGTAQALTNVRNYLANICTYQGSNAGNFTPAQILAALQSAHIQLSDICNPYLINYDNLFSPPGRTQQSCRSDNFYTGARDFFNTWMPNTLRTASSATPLPAPFVVGTSNDFDTEIGTILNNNVPLASGAVLVGFAYSTFDPTNNVYRLRLLAPTGDTIVFYLRGQGSGSTVQCNGIFNNPTHTAFQFTDVKCIRNFQGFSADGYIGNYAFEADVKRTDTVSGQLEITNCSLLGWSEASPAMAATNANTIAACVPCTEMRKLYKQFSDSMTAYGVKGYDHPFYLKMLRNYMNYNLRKSFTFNDYTGFMNGCALADSLAIYNYMGYAQVEFVDDASADAFIADIQNNQGAYLNNILRFRDGAGNGYVNMLLDMSGISSANMLAVQNAINAYTTPKLLSRSVNARFNPANKANFAGWVLVNSAYNNFNLSQLPASVTNAFTFDGPDNYDILMGPNPATDYETHDVYTVLWKGSASNADISLAVHDLQSFLYDNQVAGSFMSARIATVGKDYLLPEKKTYLNYAWTLMGNTMPEVLDSLSSTALDAGIFSGRHPSYTIPSAPGTVRNLYLNPSSLGATPGMNKVQYILETVRQASGNNRIFFSGGSQTWSVSSNPDIKAYRCSDGTFWYRYFGTGDTLYDVFLTIPKYISSSTIGNYTVSTGSVSMSSGSLYPGQGSNAINNFKLVVQDPLGQPLVFDGYTDFNLGTGLVLNNVMLSLPGANHTGTVTTGSTAADTADNCERERLKNAITEGRMRYMQYRDSFGQALYNAFYAHVMSQIQENLFLKFADQRFNYTLYYYDRAGNKIATVPPDGVHKLGSTDINFADSVRQADSSITRLPSHLKRSSYYYNTLNQPLDVITPDGGESQFFYDAAGRVVFSQNDKQKLKSNYTYTFYDAQGRVTETGQVTLGCPYFVPYMSYYTVIVSGQPTKIYVSPPSGCYSIDQNGYYTSVHPMVRNVRSYKQADIVSAIRVLSRTDVVVSVYDTAALRLDTLPAMNLQAQENLRRRISCTKYFSSLAAADTTYKNYDHASHYSYDVEGNVKTLVQDMPVLGELKQRYKRIDYDYDLISGKVNMVSYNRSHADQYYHRYTYDDDNRITLTETSNDGFIWNRDASYDYYRHGPLARTSVGDLRVQGLDYAYTIQGWLKSINGDVLRPDMDMHYDGIYDSTITSADAAGTTLDYFKGDYRPIGARAVTHLQAQSKNLYNGNIARQTTGILPFQSLTATYQYDQLNRLKAAAYAAIDPNAGTATTNIPLAGIPGYKSSYSYDPDGNLKKLVRYGPTVLMDSLDYSYPSVTQGQTNDRLQNLKDYAANNSANGGNDILATNTASDKFLYDQTGNTVKDYISNQDTIIWNLNNKVTETRNNAAGTTLKFMYDAGGNRTAKIYTQSTDTLVKENCEYYVRDAQGNILAVYNRENIYTVSPLVLVSTVNTSVKATVGTTVAMHNFITPVVLNIGSFGRKMEDYVATHGTQVAQPLSWYLLNNDAVAASLLDVGVGYLDPLRDWEIANGQYTTADAANAGWLNRDDHVTNSLPGVFLGGDNHDYNRYIAGIMDWAGDDMLRAIVAWRTGSEAPPADNGDNSALLDAAADVFSDYGWRDNPELTYGLRDLTSAYPDAFSLFLDTVSHDTQALDGDGVRDRWAAVLATAMPVYADRVQLGTFFDGWSAAADLKSTLPDDQRRIADYNSDAASYVAAVAADPDGAAYIDQAIADIPGLDVADYAEALLRSVATTATSTVLNTVTQQVHMATQQNIRSRHYWLDEHHLYGSARLGVKKYYRGQYYMDYDYSSGTPVADTLALQVRTPWYSAALAELVKSPAITEYQNLQTDRMNLQQILGQKQYEVTNHLGNVLATISDKRQEAVISGTTDTIRYFRPVLSSAYDYYPFGMLMPSRYVQDTAQHCTIVSQTTLVPVLNGIVVQNLSTCIGSTSCYTVTANGVQGILIQGNCGYVRKAVSVTPNQSSVLRVTTTFPDRTGTSNATFRLSVKKLVGATYTEVASALVPANASAITNLSFIPVNGTVYLDIENIGNLTSQTSQYGQLVVAEVDLLTRTYQQQVAYVQLCDKENDKYRFGFNGQMKTNEIAGIGNHNTAEYWEYDTRLGRRWNIDPKPIIGVSPYSSFNNNPIAYNDIQGDSAWTTSTTESMGDRKTETRTIHITGKVLDLAGIKTGGGGCSSPRDAANDYINNLNAALNTTEYHTQENGVNITYKFEAKFSLAKSMSEVSSSDHLVAIVDDVLGKADQSLKRGSEAGGIAEPNGKIAYVENSKNIRWLVEATIHELGHNLGLGHDDNGTGTYMSYDDKRSGFGTGMIPMYWWTKQNLNNQGSNSSTSGKNDSNWFWHTSTNEDPYDLNVKKGQRIPFIIINKKDN